MFQHCLSTGRSRLCHVAGRAALALLLTAGMTAGTRADEPDVARTVEDAIRAAGGKDKLLTLFRVRERLNVSPNPDAKGNERTSVIEPPKYWWLGKRERVREDKEPAIFLVWGWTLGALTSPDSKLEAIPEVVDQDKPARGVRVSGSVTPPMDMYFDKETNRLVRIDWRADIHRFSDWKEHDGATYPAKCVGYRKNTGKPWYFTEILAVERLTELPAGLSR